MTVIGMKNKSEEKENELRDFQTSLKLDQC